MPIKHLEVIPKFNIHAMSNMNHEVTGLPEGICIWVQDAGLPRLQHALRIKVSNIRGRASRSSAESFSVIVDQAPRVISGMPVGFSNKELKTIFEWVKRHDELLHQLALEEINVATFISQLR